MRKPETGARAPEHGSGNHHHHHEETENRAEREARDQRAGFAQALAQSAFGRFYWGERQEKEFRRALSRKPPGGAKPR